MAPKKMGTLFRNLADRFGNGSPSDPTATVPRKDGFSTAKGIDALFPRTRPETDGDACLHDCETCTIQYPRKFSIEEHDKLYGEIKGWSRHLIVATGKTDWVRDVEDETGSVMEAVGKNVDGVTNGRLMLSASNIPLPDDDDDDKGPHLSDGPYGPHRPTTVLLMPAFTFVDNVTPTHVPALIQSVINSAPTNTTPMQSSHSESTTNGNGHIDPTANGSIATTTIPHQPLPSPPVLPAGLSLRACPHNYLILLCSQATRDARCGQTAPLLRRELERHLRPLGLYRDLGDERPGGVGIYFISHVGGHKYSANMLVYRRSTAGGRTVQEQMDNKGGSNNNSRGETTGEAAQCIWLARVRPEDCENIVRFTVLQGKVVKPDRQLRGGFDRERGMVSW